MLFGTVGTQIVPDEELYHYDGLCVFTSIIEGKTFLFFLVDMDDDLNHYLVREIDEKTLTSFKSSKLSVRDTFVDDAANVDLNHDFLIVGVEESNADDRDQLLPKQGVYLSA